MGMAFTPTRTLIPIMPVRTIVRRVSAHLIFVWSLRVVIIDQTQAGPVYMGRGRGMDKGEGIIR